MMHREFQQLIGGINSLEAKCRFLAGVGVLLLVTTVFFFYGQKTEKLLMGQTTQTARRLVNPTIKDMHYKSKDFIPAATAHWFDQLTESFKRQDDLPEYSGRILDPYNPDKNKNESDSFEAAASRHLVQSASTPGPSSRRPYTFPDGSTMEEWQVVPGKARLQYAQAVLYRPECVSCHMSTGHGDRASPTGKPVAINAGDLACVAVIELPLDAINRDINQNRAILISAALVTAIVAMLGSYAMIRYLIVQAVAPAAPSA